MYQDARLMVSGSISTVDNTITGQTVTGTGATVLSTNTIDLLQNRELGAGYDFFARFITQVAASGGTSVEFQAVTADDALLSTNLTVLGSTGAIPVANLIAGSINVIDLPPRVGSKGQRFLGLRYITVGAVVAGVYIGDYGLEVQDGKKFYPSGFAII